MLVIRTSRLFIPLQFGGGREVQESIPVEWIDTLRGKKFIEQRFFWRKPDSSKTSKPFNKLSAFAKSIKTVQ